MGKMKKNQIYPIRQHIVTILAKPRTKCNSVRKSAKRQEQIKMAHLMLAINDITLHHSIVDGNIHFFYLYAFLLFLFWHLASLWAMHCAHRRLCNKFIDISYIIFAKPLHIKREPSKISGSFVLDYLSPFA